MGVATKIEWTHHTFNPSWRESVLFGVAVIAKPRSIVDIKAKVFVVSEANDVMRVHTPLPVVGLARLAVPASGSTNFTSPSFVAAPVPVALQLRREATFPRVVVCASRRSLKSNCAEPCSHLICVLCSDARRRNTSSLPPSVSLSHLGARLVGHLLTLAHDLGFYRAGVSLG